ncbi:hypothetical protein BH10ACI3_BH10ACI3_18990 [soil metagenome]
MTMTKMPQKLRPMLLLVAMIFAGTTAFGQETKPFSIDESPLPPSTGFVNDYVGVFDPAAKQALETKLKNLKDTTNPSVEIAVAVIKTTGDRPIADYALAVYRGWKIGSKEGDNPGALLLVAVDDRKYFTEVGRDLEDELPDGLAGSIQRQYLVPEFKKGNYSKGISDTVDAYIDVIRNKGNTADNANKPKPAAGSQGTTGFSLSGLFCCSVIFLVILVIYFNRNNRGGPGAGDRNRWGGGGFGSGGGTGGNILSGVIGGIIGSALSGGGSSSDSDSSGSDWGGSSGGWGGFGGGGDAGGGGAGGDW